MIKCGMFIPGAGDVDRPCAEEHVQGRQRDVNRELVPAVQEAMRPGWGGASPAPD